MTTDEKIRELALAIIFLGGLIEEAFEKMLTIQQRYLILNMMSDINKNIYELKEKKDDSVSKSIKRNSTSGRENDSKSKRSRSH